MEILDWCLIVGTFNIFLTTSPTYGKVQVPDVTRCEYSGASIKCWWNRPKNDNTTQYILTYIKGYDPIHDRKAQSCYPTLPSVDSNEVLEESCEIIEGVYLYAEFTMFVSVRLNCTQAETKNVCRIHRGKPFTLECNPENVALEMPPQNFTLDISQRKITWEPPSQPNSMLKYLYDSKHIIYKLSYTKWNSLNDFSTPESSWKVWYTGEQKSFYLPTLDSDAYYKVMLYAAFADNVEEDNKPFVWSKPSRTITFKLPDLPTTMATGSIQSTISTYNSTQNIPEKDTTKEFIGKITSVLLVSVGVVSFLVCYCICKKYQYCFCCPNKVKISKPLVMIELENFNLEALLPEDDLLNENEIAMPVSSLQINLPNKHSLKQSIDKVYNHSRYFRSFVCEYSAMSSRSEIVTSNNDLKRANSEANLQRHTLKRLPVCDKTYSLSEKDLIGLCTTTMDYVADNISQSSFKAYSSTSKDEEHSKFIKHPLLSSRSAEEEAFPDYVKYTSDFHSTLEPIRVNLCVTSTHKYDFHQNNSFCCSCSNISYNPPQHSQEAKSAFCLNHRKLINNTSVDENNQLPSANESGIVNVISPDEIYHSSDTSIDSGYSPDSQ